MNIIIPIIIVAAIGLIAGVGLSIASIVMAVPVDEKVTEIRGCLPGANCGACGYSGCDGYAAALASGEAANGLCSPGGAKCAADVAAVLGEEVGEFKRRAAVVHCDGTCDKTEKLYDYRGIQTCAGVSLMFGGDGKCSYGCIGLGDCVKACQYGAISICNGVAVINTKRCAACSECVAACPKGLIRIVYGDKVADVSCSNKDKGAAAKKACKNACIGCMRCVKACESGAVTVSNNLATVDSEKCTGCGKCFEVCPSKCIRMIDLKALQEA
ncbi:MAG: RnfABCDGE type electron transport complex subunit B [Clostridia bacterium]|nr:RnfABCDGE type electron transport complex subunit B [Clostridia bacterium]